ncbi:zinc finger protein 675-like [Phlebotomus argentipes]|uniref:zinc finger protein 675-like n=1 Tax=Phlebotomus argentipes TaxID=94469 RepID=UPI002892F67D|nr:zinc finger protein 675-like [Phlebotomus argentipes]
MRFRRHGRNRVKVYFNSIVVKEEYLVQGEPQTDYDRDPENPGYSQEIHFDIIELEVAEKENSQENRSTPETVVAEEKNFPCRYCGKLFRSIYSRDEHVVVHTEERNFPCSICTKTFRHKSNLRRHVRGHYAFNEACPICEKVFHNYESLKEHKKRHTEKRFQCDLCHHRFVYQCHLTKHMQNSHQNHI